ncbi:hypothetical protein DRW48_01905 [Paracoccus suum]|uniref:Sulfate transporter family protein n=1 Tax=Paracoccus suum TaxID=2259340 RepID=A0A344PNP8_9RHOB|nr:hypothetical protein DRW48_01905 [Paracoccus suum]
MVLRALVLALSDMLRPSLLGLVGRALLLTLAVLIALQASVTVAIRLFAPHDLDLPWLGTVAVGNLLSWGSLALLPVLALVLMAPVAALFCGMMSDNVASRIEGIHYPARRGREQSFRAGLADGISVMLIVLVFSLAMLVLSPVLGPAAHLLFYGGNGWLLGREFFQSAAVRHLPAVEAAALRRSMSGKVTAAGTMVALLLTVPVLNILVPVMAMAAFTHLYHLSAAGSDPRSRYPRG